MAGNPFKKKLTLEQEKTKAIESMESMRVSNRLLESVIKKNNEVALKILLYIGKQIQGLELQNIEVPNKEIITLKLDRKRLCETCNISDKRLRESIKAIQKTIVSFEDKKEKWVEDIVVIPRAEYHAGKNEFEIDMYNKVLELVTKLERHFTIIDSKNAMRLNSAYSLRLIPVLEHIAGFSEHAAKRKDYDLNQLNSLFGTNYKRIGQLIDSVIKPVKEEMDRVSAKSFMYEVNYEAVPRGRPKAINVTIDLIKNQPQLF